MTDHPDMDPAIPEDDLLAAELALGALDFEERARLQARAAWDPAFAGRVAAWEALLAPMAEEVAEAPPPPSARRRLMRELFGDRNPDAPRNVIPADAKAHEVEAQLPPHSRLRREIAGWRALAFASVAAAAVLVFQPQILDALRGPGTEPRYLALIADPAGDLSFVAMLDEETGRILARRAGGADPAEGSVYQLWMATDGDPVSLGLLEGEGPLRTPLPRQLEVDGTLPPSTHFAVSLEPAGGSPTGLPTGPVVARGGRPEGL